MTTARPRIVVLAGAAILALTTLAGPAGATTPRADHAPACVDHGTVTARRGGWIGTDHRDVTAAEQAAIERRTQQILAAKGTPGTKGGSGVAGVGSGTAADIPVYVHVMMDSAGRGNVTDGQIAEQIAVLNKTYAGAESPDASNTGFTFTLAGTDRWYNTSWHKDGQSTTYRAKTRQGGADALNIWLVDFRYLGIATFPWDYASNPSIDGIRVNVGSLPGGDITNYNHGETATHETGHWLGLYHTFQGGCTEPNDEVSDTPEEGSPSTGCPVGKDTCTLPGLDPIHNYMDYSYDTCYTMFTAGQTSRMQQMFAAYRS